MKTVRFHHTGGPEVLVYEDVPTPSPAAGEVLLRVDAVGVNFSDVLRRRGDDYPETSPTPFTLGGEVAGTVVALGDACSGFSAGDAVYATTRIGGYAQYVVVPQASVVPIPKGISPIEATALVVQGLTAALALRHAGRFVRGDTVLVEAAAGGVGSFAVQLAKLDGAKKVIAAASTAAKRDKARTLGADEAVDYMNPDWPAAVRKYTDGRGVDVILEMTGGNTVGEALDSLGPFGRMVVYGLASGVKAVVDPQRLTIDNQALIGFYIGAYFRRYPTLVQETLAELVDHVVSGRIQLQVGMTLPLSKAAEAHRLLESRETSGKLVLQPWKDV